MFNSEFEGFWRTVLYAAGGFFAVILGLIVGFQIWAPGVVNQFNGVLEETTNTTVIYDRNGNTISSIEGVENRRSIPITRISPYMQKAVVAIEDRRFFSHRGLDPIRLAGALWADIKAMGFKQGGSTITQQLVKLTLLTPERTLSRKIKELFIAVALEQEFPKLKLLEFYLNRVYMGFGVYGVEKASRAYFHKPATDLTIAEAAFLAALVKKPEGYLISPEVQARADEPTIPVEYLYPLMRRQRQVIKTLLELGWISRDEYAKAMSTRLVVNRPKREVTNAPYFVQDVLKKLRDELGVQRVSGRGYQVYTTLDPHHQMVAEKLISRLSKRSEKLQASLVAIDPHSGHVTAMVGGVDYAVSQFNRAVQAARQPGSAFKPILYATALENGYSTRSVFLDEPVRYISDKTGHVSRVYEADIEFNLPLLAEAEPPPDENEADNPEQEGEEAKEPEEPSISIYNPRNYNNSYGVVRGRDEDNNQIADKRITLGRALELSSNVVAVQLLDKLGMHNLIRQSERWNLPIRARTGLCAALGCSEVNLINLTAAYSSFANGGLISNPVTILKVTNPEGEVIYEHIPDPPVEAISPWTAFQMQHMLTNVVNRGTGRRARLNRPAGGKTGTNVGPKDTWFVGFTPTLVAGVWMGTDDNQIMEGETGGRTTASLWRDFMKYSLPTYEGQTFPEPPQDYTGLKICNLDGELADDECPQSSVHYLNHAEVAEVLSGSEDKIVIRVDGSNDGNAGNYGTIPGVDPVDAPDPRGSQTTASGPLPIAPGATQTIRD